MRFKLRALGKCADDVICDWSLRIDLRKLMERTQYNERCRLELINRHDLLKLSVSLPYTAVIRG